MRFALGDWRTERSRRCAVDSLWRHASRGDVSAAAARRSAPMEESRPPPGLGSTLPKAQPASCDEAGPSLETALVPQGQNAGVLLRLVGPVGASAMEQLTVRPQHNIVLFEATSADATNFNLRCHDCLTTFIEVSEKRRSKRSQETQIVRHYRGENSVARPTWRGWSRRRSGARRRGGEPAAAKREGR